MEAENVIRKEAKLFFDQNLKGALKKQPIESFRDLKLRLYDFYSVEFKAIFLDEVQKLVAENLQNHRDKAHNGLPKADCPIEISAEKLLFYINQEIGTFPKIAHQKSVIAPQHTRTSVFISYCHKDKDALVDIQRHFKPFKGAIALWDDSKILPGQKWKSEIQVAINSAKVAILLVSTDFLGSEFISNDEVPALLKAAEEDGAVILIVILKPCLFEEFPNLNQFQAMNPPDRPISRMSVDEKEELHVNLVRQTKRVLDGQS